MLLAELGALLVQAAADAEGRQDGTTGVIFVRDRRAEEREEAVATEVVDRAAEPIDLAEGQFRNWLSRVTNPSEPSRSVMLTELMMSQKRAVICLRSPTDASGSPGCVAGDGGAVVASRRCPQAAQNRAASPTSCPQVGHRRASRDPHCSQNRAASAFSARQAGHRIVRLPW